MTDTLETITPETPETPEVCFPYTESGNAERLVQMFGDYFRWLSDIDCLYTWDDKVWRPDKDGNLLLPATKIVARSIVDPKWQHTSESLGKRRAMIALAKAEQEQWSESKYFDTHPTLLNVANGTLDLEKYTLRDFNRADFLSKQAPVLYDPSAKCPKFDAFMDFVFAGDQETIHFMLKALGYTLTGCVGESCFFICYGLGANGKTTLIETLMQILGVNFARPAKFSTFVTTRMLDPKYELATFKGMRLVTAVEPDKTGHLDEAVLK